jgi:hypothetical protein
MCKLSSGTKVLLPDRFVIAEERQRRSNPRGGSAASLTLGTSSTMSASAERRHDPKGSHYMYEIATPEPALSGAEILRLQLRMTGGEGARNDRAN